MKKLHQIFIAISCMATLALNGATTDSTPKTDGNYQYMILKRAPMQDLAAADATTDTSSMTLFEIIQADPSFSTFSRALKAAGKDVINGDGPYTIFVPNDAAFAKLSPNAQEDLFKPENKDKLAAILTYHIVQGNIPAADLKTSRAATVDGKTLDIKVDANGITVNNAKVTKADIAGTNGVIHVIDTVMIP